MTDRTETSFDTPQLAPLGGPDDIAGILIHNCNMMASYLSAQGPMRADWATLDAHVSRMLALTRETRVMVDAMSAQFAAEQAAASNGAAQ